MALPGLAPSAIGIAGGAILRTDIRAFIESAPDIEQGLVAEDVFPVFPVDSRDGQYLTATLTDTGVASTAGQPRAPGAAFARNYRQQNSRQYSCLNYGVEGPVAQEIEDYLNGDFGFDVQAEHTKYNLRGMKLLQEQRVANALMNSANYTATAASVAYLLANQPTTATTPCVPMFDITSAITRLRAQGVLADTIVLSLNLANYILSCGTFLQFVKPFGVGSPGSIPDLSYIKKAFEQYGITRVLIPWANINTAPLGSTAAMSPIWPDTYIWVGKAGTGNSTSTLGGAGRLFTWKKQGGLYTVVTYWEQQTKSTIIQVEQFVAEVILGVEAGGSATGVSTFGQLITTSYTGS